MYFVYVLSSKKRSYLYVGMTEDISKRFAQHCAGRVKSTKPYRPFDLVHVEEYSTKEEPRSREIYLKSGAGKELLKSVIN